jgi:hypothetical protein
MKLMISGMTNSAAISRSPSFSRSASSTSTTIRPARTSVMISVMGLTPVSGLELMSDIKIDRIYMINKIKAKLVFDFDRIM